MLRALIGGVMLAFVVVQSVAQTEPVGPETPLNLPPNPVPAPTLPQASPKPGDTNQYPTYTGNKPAAGAGQSQNAAPGSQQ